MFRITEIAQALLSYDQMSHKKLQKLCYYTELMHLALEKKSLINGKFEAWIHGPVNRELFYNYRVYGWNVIPKGNTYVLDRIKQENSSAAEIIDITWRIFGSYTGDELEELTHLEIPWQEAREGFSPMEPCTNELKLDSMRKQGILTLEKLIG